MHFNKTISLLDETAVPSKTFQRTAVRAIILEKGKVLMVRSNRGYYKLPGGGVENGETFSEALMREVAEESGYKNCRIIKRVGTVTEQRPDRSFSSHHFHMDSHYFICEVNGKEKGCQALDSYEREEGYKPVWIPAEKAFDANQLIYEKEPSKAFIVRENFVLKWVSEYLQKGVTIKV